MEIFKSTSRDFRLLNAGERVTGAWTFFGGRFGDQRETPEHCVCTREQRPKTRNDSQRCNQDLKSATTLPRWYRPDRM